jgi:dihydrofolate reductase
MPKYVVSSTLHDPEWTNSTVLSGDVVDEITKLRNEQNGDIVVHGSAQLVQSLIENDLVDELRLMVFPVVLGTGKRLFGETTDKKRLQLSSSTVVGEASPSRSTRAPDPAGTWPPQNDEQQVRTLKTNWALAVHRARRTRCSRTKAAVWTSPRAQTSRTPTRAAPSRRAGGSHRAPGAPPAAHARAASRVIRASGRTREKLES